MLQRRAAKSWCSVVHSFREIWQETKVSPQYQGGPVMSPQHPSTTPGRLVYVGCDSCALGWSTWCMLECCCRSERSNWYGQSWLPCPSPPKNTQIHVCLQKLVALKYIHIYWQNLLASDMHPSTRTKDQAMKTNISPCKMTMPQLANCQWREKCRNCHLMVLGGLETQVGQRSKYIGFGSN